MTTSTLTSMLDGSIVTLCVVVAVCFLRLHRLTVDRLYLAFAVAFVCLGLNWGLLAVQGGRGDRDVLVFLPRLVAFLVIILAIIDKNRRAGGHRPSTTSSAPRPARTTSPGPARPD